MQENFTRYNVYATIYIDNREKKGFCVMKRLAIGLLLLVALAACGASDDTISYESELGNYDLQLEEMAQVTPNDTAAGEDQDEHGTEFYLFWDNAPRFFALDNRNLDVFYSLLGEIQQEDALVADGIDYIHRMATIRDEDGRQVGNISIWLYDSAEDAAHALSSMYGERNNESGERFVRLGENNDYMLSGDATEGYSLHSRVNNSIVFTSFDPSQNDVLEEILEMLGRLQRLN